MLEQIIKRAIKLGYQDFNFEFNSHITIQAKHNQPNHHLDISDLVHPSQIIEIIYDQQYLTVKLSEFSMSNIIHHASEDVTQKIMKTLVPINEQQMEDDQKVIEFEQNLTKQVTQQIENLWIKIDPKYFNLQWGQKLPCEHEDCWYEQNPDRMEELKSICYLPVDDGYLFCDVCETEETEYEISQKIIELCLEKWGIEL